VDDQFEQRISALMDYGPGPVPPFTAADVVAEARRRSRHRALGAAAGAAAVTAVGVGVAAAVAPSAGGASTAVARPLLPTSAASSPAPALTGPPATTPATPSTTPSTSALAVSPVRQVAPSVPFTITPGFQIYVTATQKCGISGVAGVTSGPDMLNESCKDTSSANMAWDGKGNWLSMQSGGFYKDDVMVPNGTFQGPATPSLIDAVFEGRHYTATIVETPGMRNWVAYYVEIPAPTHPIVISKDHPIGIEITVTAYDAAGHMLTRIPPLSMP
jgi:hypothetical protein